MILLTPQDKEKIDKFCEKAATQLPSPLIPPEKNEMDVRYEILPQN